MTSLKTYKPFVLFKNIQKPIHIQQYRNFNNKTTLNMPLVDPVTNSAGGDKTAEWQNKLVGKKIGDTSDEVKTFAKADLPKQTRVITPGTMVTQDFNPDRLNVHVGEDGTVTHVNHQ